MKIYTIPLQDKPSQRLLVTLGGQSVNISLTMRLGKIYADVQADGVDIVSGRVCLNLEPIIKEAFRPFVGELYFDDLQGSDDPVYGGLGRRFVLRWVTND